MARSVNDLIGLCELAGATCRQEREMITLARLSVQELNLPASQQLARRRVDSFGNRSHTLCVSLSWLAFLQVNAGEPTLGEIRGRGVRRWRTIVEVTFRT